MTANKPSDAIPEVMKRRIKELERDGYNKDFLRCFRNAIRSLDETDRYAHANKVQAEEIKALAARLAEAEQLILRMSGEGFIRAKFYVEKYDLTGERVADSAPAAPVAHNRRWSDGEPEIIVRTGDKEKEVARMVSDHAKVIASKQNTCPYCGAVQGQAHQSTCIAAAAASADPVINAQHDETGRTWRGPRSQLPSRYFEITSICCLDYPLCDCNSPPEPDNAPTLQPCGHPWKAQHDFKCILCSAPG